VISNELWWESRFYSHDSYIGRDIQQKIAYYYTRKENYKLIRIDKEGKYEEILLNTIKWLPVKNDKILSLEKLFDTKLNRKLKKKEMLLELKKKILKKWNCNYFESFVFDLYLEAVFKILKISFKFYIF